MDRGRRMGSMHIRVYGTCSWDNISALISYINHKPGPNTTTNPNPNPNPDLKPNCNPNQNPTSTKLSPEQLSQKQISGDRIFKGTKCYFTINQITSSIELLQCFKMKQNYFVDNIFMLWTKRLSWRDFWRQNFISPSWRDWPEFLHTVNWFKRDQEIGNR